MVEVKPTVVVLNERGKGTTREVNFNDDESLLLKLASKKRFDKLTTLLMKEYTEPIDTLLSTGPSSFSESKSSLFSTDRSSYSTASKSVVSPTLLHEVLAYRPPVAVVELLCNVLESRENLSTSAGPEMQLKPRKEIEMKSNHKGCKPLHLAVIHGCEVDVIKRLIKVKSISQSESNPKKGRRPTMSVDQQGRTALHWACANPSGATYPQGSSSKSKNSLATTGAKSGTERTIKIVEILVKDYPKAVVMEDANGQTPMDLACEYKADVKILKILYKAMNRVKKREERMGDPILDRRKPDSRASNKAISTSNHDTSKLRPKSLLSKEGTASTLERKLNGPVQVFNPHDLSGNICDALNPQTMEMIFGKQQEALLKQNASLQTISSPRKSPSKSPKKKVMNFSIDRKPQNMALMVDEDHCDLSSVSSDGVSKYAFPTKQKDIEFSKKKKEIEFSTKQDINFLAEQEDIEFLAEQEENESKTKSQMYEI